MGWFDKKYCDICGEKIGLFGNRKLEDGNMCSSCAKKLSPWFTERRHTNLAEIKEQLAYREENRKAVRDFHITREMGESTKVLLDENAGTFMVTDQKNLEKANPDVIGLDRVTDCTMEISDYRSELYHQNKDGEREPYNPRRYEYNYEFYVKIQLDHPYIDEIRFRLNAQTLEIEYSDNSWFGLGGLNPERDADYRYYRDTAQEIVNTLRGHYEKKKEPEPAVAQTHEQACPYCGAQCSADSSGCCPYCGGRLDG